MVFRPNSPDMSKNNPEKKSQLIAVLREGVAVVQMVLFKELKTVLARKYPEKEEQFLSMLTGSITNELFGTRNPAEKFAHFRKEQWGIIEQELLGLKDELPRLCPRITDALRIQVLCDHQEGEDSSQILVSAKEFGVLQEDREIPLPSTFMTLVRILGEEHNLIIAPVQISPEDDGLVH